MAKQSVYVEVEPTTFVPIRILRTTKDAMDLPPERVTQMARSVAVGYIRKQVIDRARRKHGVFCEYCGEPINEFLGEMHEKLPKGSGGEVSLDNCVFLCHDCHTGKKDSEHGDRRWQTAKDKDAGTD
jgi:5-methylcytosine-specific restriction endonuclease McrA